MITDMRDSVSSWPIRIVLILIILSFVSFYGWNQRESLKAGEVAHVNGESISARDFAFQYQNLIQSYQNQGKLSTDIPENLQSMIKQQLLTSLIYQKLKSSESKKVGLVASDDKVKDVIKKQFSDKDGKFDFKFYESFLRNQLGKTPGQYEEEMRSNIRADMFEQLILETGLASNLDLKNAYKQTNEKVTLSYVKLNDKNTASFRPKAKAPSEEELKKFYADHSEQFKTKEKRKLEIAFFEQASFAKSANFSKEAEGILQEISANNASIKDAKAKEPRLQSVETGLISYEDHVSPFTAGELTEILNSTQNLETGKSTVLVSRDGKKVYLTKVLELQESKLPELASIKASVEKAYAENQNEASFDAWVESTWTEVTKGAQTLDALAKKTGTSVKTTAEFAYAPSNIVPEIGANEEIMNESFKHQPKEFFSKPVKMGSDYVLVQLKSKTEPDWKKFETDQDNLSNVMHQQSAQARFVSWMQNVEEHSKVRREMAAPTASPAEE